MRDEDILYNALDLLVDILNKNVNTDKVFAYDKSTCDTVLINSNFRCGFYLNREALYDILKKNIELIVRTIHVLIQVFNVNSSDKTLDVQNGQQPIEKKSTIKVSFMIFRTGSALIVGKCSEDVLNIIYEFLCKLLKDEYPNISCGNNNNNTYNKTNSKKYTKRKLP